MQAPAEKAMGQFGAEAVQPLLMHFDAIEAGLLALKSLLADIGDSTGEPEVTRDVMTRIAAAYELLDRLNSDTNVILKDLSQRLQVDESELTVRLLLRFFDQHDATTADALRASRRRLLRLRWQTGRIAAGSGWIISEERRYRHAVMQCASGMTDSDRYDSSGRMALTPDAVQFGTRS